ncbi:MAG: histidine kinase [Bacteroidota bacterium]
MTIQLKERYVRWFGIPILGFIMTLATPHNDGTPFYKEYLISLLFTAFYWNGCYIIFMMFRRVYPSIHQTAKRLIITTTTTTLFMVAAGIPIRILLGLVEVPDIANWRILFEHTPASLVAALIVCSLYENAFFFDKWKATIKQNEELKNQQVRTQFEVLQNQMSPHFLFNSLNALTTLIAESQDVAIEFTQKLSEVYRYILQTKDKELVKLSEELEFVRAYLFLLQMRYPDNLHCHFSIDAKCRDHYIPPLTLQMLVENAVKHNVVSKSSPLKIEIYSENGLSVIVKNNLQLKKTLEKSTKTGLANIKKRYQFLGNREIDIITTARNYMVAVPLITLVKEPELTLVH